MVFLREGRRPATEKKTSEMEEEEGVGVKGEERRMEGG